MKLFIVTLLAGSLLVYQNCSKVNLEQSLETEPPYILKSTVDLCLDGTLANYTLESSYFTNLNMSTYKDSMLLDSDADGVPDKIEEEFGTNPSDRYSNSKIMDSLCLFQKGGVDCNKISNCNPSKFVGVGLNECDLEAAGLGQFAHPTKGLDSDRDGFLDFIEIIKNTIPSINDASSDPDKDLVLNAEEIRSGSNPNYADKNFDPQLKVIFKASKVSNASCSGEFWKVEVDNLRVFKIKDFLDPLDSLRGPTDLKFSHERNENIIFGSLVLAPKTGSTGNTFIYTYSKRIYHDGTSGGELKLLLSDFIKNGEVKTSL